LLPAADVQRVLAGEHVQWRDCVYSPLVTLWTFLLKTLCLDHSCRQAVARLRAFLTADGQRPCAAETGPYCKARRKLPEIVGVRLAREVGAVLHERVSDRGLLNGRPVKLADGSTVSMPDTAANQAAYPQSRSQQPGLGFPLARGVGLSIKITMQMEVRRCQTPEMVRKEIWMHLLAYNPIRTVMAEAAERADLRPREVSFKGALQTLAAYRPLVEQATPRALPLLYESLLDAIGSHRVGNRLHRSEPRAIKRRPKPHDLLTIPRHEAKRRLTA
jgi:hypothetical protein